MISDWGLETNPCTFILCLFTRIVKLRGIAQGDLMDKGFFIILDRLHETLDVTMKTWAKTEKKFKGIFLGVGRNKKALRDLMMHRMLIAYDLAAAFMYLHENRCVLLCVC
jgi:hypothetical protein